VTGVAASLVPLLAGDSWGSDVRVQKYKHLPDADAVAFSAGYIPASRASRVNPMRALRRE
jgi:hypothetical protein